MYHCNFCKLRNNVDSYNIVLDHGYFCDSTNLDTIPKLSDDEWDKINKKLDSRMNEYESWKGDGCNKCGWFFGYNSSCFECCTKDSYLDGNIEFIKTFKSSYNKK
jgi:hypothetical protein